MPESVQEHLNLQLCKTGSKSARRYRGGDWKRSDHRPLFPLVAVRELRNGGLDQLLVVSVPDAHGVGMGTGPEEYRLVLG